MAHPLIEKAVYNTRQWRRFRAAYGTSRNWICEHCGEPGRVVHHIEELTLSNYLDATVAYAEDNVELLCWACHEKTKKGQGLATRDDVRFDSEGNVVPSGKRAPGLIPRTLPPVF